MPVAAPTRTPRRLRASVRYALDERNRLVVRERDDATGRLRPRRIAEGTVTTDRANRLIYLVDAPTSADGQPDPHRYELDGTWRLTRDHRLTLALHEAQRGEAQTLFLKGELVEANAHALTVTLDSHGLKGRRTAQRLTLRGRWQADPRNRLTFLVEKADGSADRLVLQGGWSVDEHHGLRYEYRVPSKTEGRRLALARRPQAVQALQWTGAWDIAGAGRLVYRVEGSTDSAFEFRASLQSRSLNARDGRLVYQVGIGLERGRTFSRRVTLFGTWKLHKDLSVSFEVPYAQRRREAMRFHARYAFGDRHAVALALLNQRGHPLGLAVTFSRRWLDDAHLFLEARKQGEDAEVLGGVRMRF